MGSDPKCRGPAGAKAAVGRVGASRDSVAMEPEEMRSVFVDRGVLRLDAAFTASEAERIRAVIWGHVDRRLGLRADDRSDWPTDGWLPISWKGLKRNRAFDAML